MMNSYPRAGPSAHSRHGPLASFQQNLASLRGRLCEGLTETASHAVSESVRRLAALLFGHQSSRPRQSGFQGYPREYGNTASWDEYDPEAWDDPWSQRSQGWTEPDEKENDLAFTTQNRPGSVRPILAALCQAGAWILRSLSPESSLLTSLASVILSALALLTGGSTFACETGLALAEAVWTLVSALTADPGNRDDD